MEVIVSVVTVVTSILAALIGLAKLTQHQRRAVWDWSRRLTLLIFYLVVAVSSVTGMVIFATRTEPMTRPEVLMQLGHAFNLISYAGFFIADLAKWIRASEESSPTETTETALAVKDGES